MHRLTRLSLAWPRTALALLLAITVLLGAGLPRVRSEYGYRVLVGDDHPSIRALDALIAQFGGGLPLQIAWECAGPAPCRRVFDPASLAMADAVTRALAGTQGVRGAIGPANAPLLVPQSGGYAIRRFVEHGRVAADADALAARALADPLWTGRLVSRDGRVGVVVVQPADTRPATDRLVVDTVQSVLAPFEQGGFRFHLAGDAAEGYLGGVDLADGNARMVPIAVAIMGAMLFVLTRSGAQALAVLGTMGVTLVWTFGLLGWLGWPRDGILEVLAALLLVVGVCDSMHFLTQLSGEREADAALPDPEGALARRARLVRAAREVGGACTFTALTDAGAFASFATSSLDTFVRFGWISAFGVMAALVLSFSLLPLAMSRLRHDRRPRGHGRHWSAALDRIVPLASRRARPILAACAAALLLFGYGWLALLRVDTDWLESWGDRSERTRAIRFIQDRLGNLKTIELRVTLPPDASLEDGASLRVVDALERALSELDDTLGVASALDLVARVNRLLHDDDPAFERAPESSAGIAEILELLAQGDESVLAPWISIDRSQLRLSVESHELAYRKGQEFIASVRAACARVLPAGWSAELTGEIPMTVDWVDDVQATQLRGFPTAVLTVYLLMAAFLRSPLLALAALLPTLLPIAVTLGSMGWLGLDLDVGRAMIGTVVVGIGVDDAIHLLGRYRAQRAAGRAARAAMSDAIRHGGRAIVTNSLALALGFLTLMLSPWQSISSFGFFAALTIVGALVATLLVLPALIFAFDRPARA